LHRESISKISVLFASDPTILPDSVMNLLDHTDNVKVVARAETQKDVLPLADVHRPHLAVLDLDVEWDAIHHLARGLFCRKIPTLLISNTIDDAIAVELVQSGVSGVIRRRTSPELLYKSLRAVVSGEIWVSRQIVAKLVGHMRMLPKSPPIAAETSPPTAIHLQSLKPLNRYGLTRRELQVVQAVGDAMTNKKIAHLLEMSECTVKHHLSKIFDKVGVHNRLELAMFAKNKGLVAPCAATVRVVA
jgi:two-component system, NarL family, nitrate/nitrite response regulator NarL